jgi:hypothetical protein
LPQRVNTFEKIYFNDNTRSLINLFRVVGLVAQTSFLFSAKSAIGQSDTPVLAHKFIPQGSEITLIKDASLMGSAFQDSIFSDAAQPLWPLEVPLIPAVITVTPRLVFFIYFTLFLSAFCINIEYFGRGLLTQVHLRWVERSR